MPQMVPQSLEQIPKLEEIIPWSIFLRFTSGEWPDPDVDFLQQHIGEDIR